MSVKGSCSCLPLPFGQLHFCPCILEAAKSVQVDLGSVTINPLNLSCIGLFYTDLATVNDFVSNQSGIA